MKTHIFHFLFTFLGLFMTSYVSAQLYPISLSQRIESASAIIKGKVVAQKSYVDSKDNIYTANLIQVEAIFKGKAEEQVVVFTKGGVVDDRIVKWAHALSLVPNQEGYFFLIPSDIEPFKDAQYDFENLRIYADVQGFIRLLIDPVSKVLIGRDPFHTYTDLKSELTDVIEKITHEKAIYLSGKDEKRSGVRYHFTNFNLSNNVVTFDIHVNSLMGAKQLYQSGIFLDYNPLALGSNLGTNGNLQLYENGISSEATYDLGLTNQSASKIMVSLKTIGNPSGLSTIDGDETLLAKGKLVYSNPFLDPQIVPDIAQSLALNKWYNPLDGLSYPFDTVVIDFDLRELVMPIITNITPDTVAAGIGQVIEITGLNFGNYVDGVSSVKFTDAHAGPGGFFHALRGDIQYWDPTTIKVAVPTVGRVNQGDSAGDGIYAGTGKIQVCNDASMCGTSMTDLFVKFTASDYWTPAGENPADQSFPISLFGANNEHGFHFSFDAGFASDTAAVISFMRALNTWKCATGLNYTTDPMHPNLSSANTAVVSYATITPGFIAETAVDAVRCKSGTNYVQGYLRSWTIQFSPTESWYKGEDESGIIGTGSYDMQSIALHELGHAHLLLHVNQADHVMWFSEGKEKPKRKLKQYDVEGGNWIMDLSGSSLTGTTCPQLTKPMFRANTTGLPCSLLLHSNEIKLNNNLIKIYPNPTNSTLNFTFTDYIGEGITINIFDVTGKLWLVKTVNEAYSDLFNLDISILPKGLYFLGIENTNGQSSYTKFIKQ